MELSTEKTHGFVKVDGGFPVSRGVGVAWHIVPASMLILPFILYFNGGQRRRRSESRSRCGCPGGCHCCPGCSGCGCPGGLGFSLLCFLLLHHRLPHLKVEKDSAECHGSQDPDVQTIEQGKIVNEAWSLGHVPG